MNRWREREGQVEEASHLPSPGPDHLTRGRHAKIFGDAFNQQAHAEREEEGGEAEDQQVEGNRWGGQSGLFVPASIR